MTTKLMPQLLTTDEAQACAALFDELRVDVLVDALVGPALAEAPGPLGGAPLPPQAGAVDDALGRLR